MTDGEPLLVDTGRGFNITYRAKTLYSPRNPRAAAVRRADTLSVEPKTLVFVPSLGLGYGLHELLARLPDSCHVLCIEIDERLFKLALSRGPRLPKSPHLSIIRTDRREQAAAIVQQLGPWRFRRVVPLHLCGGYRLYRAQYERLQRAVEEEIRLYWQNRLTLFAMTRLWLRNLFTNLAVLPACGDIVDLATDRPLLVCGAGPSLENSLSWIADHRRAVILLAVDTALPVLAQADLPPDWVFTLDAQIHTLRDFLPFRDSGMKILCDLTSNPQSLRLFRDLYFFSTRFHPLTLFDRLESARLLPTPLPPRGSVGVSAVEAALTLTSGPILFTGLDFAYSRGQTHARGAPFQLASLAENSRLRPCGMTAFQTLLDRPRLRLAGKTGEQLLTDLVLDSYRRQLVGVIESCTRCFDLSGQGLPVGAPGIDSEIQLAQLLELGENHRLRSDNGGGREGAGLEEVEKFCEHEQSLLKLVIQAIAEDSRDLSRRDLSRRDLSRLIAPVDYLSLLLPQPDPHRLLEAGNLRTIDSIARDLLLSLQHTRQSLGER